MRKLLKNTEGNVKMVGAVAGILIMLIIAVLVFYNIVSGIDYTSLNADAGPMATSTEVTNASEELVAQSETFFTIAPIVAIVIVAVVILGYVSRIG